MRMDLGVIGRRMSPNISCRTMFRSCSHMVAYTPATTLSRLGRIRMWLLLLVGSKQVGTRHIGSSAKRAWNVPGVEMLETGRLGFCLRFWMWISWVGG